MSDALSALFDISGKTAIVSGASRGIGAAAAEAFAEAGANVVLLGRELAPLREIASRLERFGVQMLPIRCDVSNAKQVANAVLRARKTFETIDILVNNAGIIRRAPAVDYPLHDWDSVIDVNLKGVFMMTQEVGRRMIEQGSGKIINVASLLSFSGGRFVPAYTASKHAVAGLTKAFANEWASLGVNVNAVAPGYIETDATAALRKDKKRYRELTARIPAGRWGKPNDLKGAFLFLASPASNYVHGHVLAVDGGWMAG